MLKTIKEGDIVTLHDGALPWVKKREWRFARMQGNIVFLSEMALQYEWETDTDNIDWNGFARP